MIIGGEGPDPSLEDAIALDDLLADAGVPVFRRPFEAAKLWGKNHGDAMLGLTKEEAFQNLLKTLHPSVPFGVRSFLTLCVSARAVSYLIKPPMGHGRVAITPIKYTDISDQEVARLWHDHKPAFYELHWQAFDAVDLFFSKVNFHSQDKAAENMLETAVNQLTASARQLAACEIDLSLPQGMAMACELAGKAVLRRAGQPETSVRKIGHDLGRLHTEITAILQSPADSDVAEVIASLPRYVDVRYDAPKMTITDAQDIFRKSMFVIADFLRRTNHDQGYWKQMNRGQLPRRQW